MFSPWMLPSHSRGMSQHQDNGKAGQAGIKTWKHLPSKQRFVNLPWTDSLLSGGITTLTLVECSEQLGSSFPFAVGTIKAEGSPIWQPVWPQWNQFFVFRHCRMPMHLGTLCRMKLLGSLLHWAEAAICWIMPLILKDLPPWDSEHGWKEPKFNKMKLSIRYIFTFGAPWLGWLSVQSTHQCVSIKLTDVLLLISKDRLRTLKRSAINTTNATLQISFWRFHLFLLNSNLRLCNNSPSPNEAMLKIKNVRSCLYFCTVFIVVA